MYLGFAQLHSGIISRLPKAGATLQLAVKSKASKTLTICLTTLGCLAIAPIALSQDLNSPVLENGVQYLTCVKDVQGLMCRSSESIQPLASVERATVPQASIFSTMEKSAAEKSPTESGFPLLSAAQQELISNLLLGFLYFVLPSGLALSMFLHDKSSARRSAALKAQIEYLERLWKQSPQAWD